MKKGDRVLVWAEVFEAPEGAPVALLIFRGAAGVPGAPIPVRLEDIEDPPSASPAG